MVTLQTLLLTFIVSEYCPGAAYVWLALMPNDDVESPKFHSTVWQEPSVY